MTITLQVSPALTQAINQHGKAAQPLLSHVEKHHGKLTALFDGNDVALVNFFIIEGIEETKREQFMYDLQRIEGIAAAYVKPTEELP